MTDVWTGTYTFLLTDIEGSTRLWDSAPADMARALDRHDQLIAALVSTHGGRLVRSRGEGDSAFAVFDDPHAALRCGVEIQRAMTHERWPAAAQIRVRSAIHAGPVQVRGDDYFGSVVNRTARLRAAAHGGQLLISEVVQGIVASALPSDVWLTDLGTHRLRDLSQPMRIWQVGHADLGVEFPSLRSLESGGHNLPLQLTTFVGREDNVIDLRKRLETSRIVTLTGPGGIGKTRLAIQTAADAVEAFPDGVWIAELARVQVQGQVASTVADALGVREEPGRDVAASVIDHLTERKVLLVLDNCEHLIDGAAAFVHDLVTTAKDVSVLATSREPLRVYGEAVYAVPTLALPADGVVFAEEAMDAEAVRLFAERASLAQHDFSLGEDTDAVVRIVQTLEGIPLAIELAAALVGTSTPSEIAGLVTNRLDALDVGPRTAPIRHRTLRAAIESSFDALTAEERSAIAQLSVFAGGFTSDAAVAVCDGEAIEQLVARLADRSLLQTRNIDDSMRYVMLETIRDFAGEQLDDATANQVHARHTAWALDFIRTQAPLLWAPDSPQAIRRIETEHDNLRSAINRALDDRDPVAGAIIERLFVYWFTTGYLHEGRDYIGRVLELDLEQKLHARLGLYLGQLASAQGDPNAIPQMEAHVAEARKLHDLETVGIGLNVLAGAAIQTGRLDDAKRFGAEALTILRIHGQPRNVVQALNALGVIATIEGDAQAARDMYIDALGISREVGMQETVARLLLNLGNLAFGEGHYERARDYYEETRDLAGKMGDVVAGSAAMMNLGVIEKALGNFAKGRTILIEALAIKRELGDGRGTAIALHGLADIERSAGRPADAHRHSLESLEVSANIDFSQGVIQNLETLAAILGESGGDARVALQLMAAAASARERTGQRRQSNDVAEFDGVLEGLRAGVGDAGDALWDDGSRLSLDEAIALAKSAPVV